MKSQTVSKILGLTQKELSGMLGVSRAQVSMFESGKRSLPLQATELLGQLLTNAQDAKTFAKGDPHAARRQDYRRQHIERLLIENEYQRQTFEKKVAAAERKVAAQVNLLKLAGSISQTSTHKGTDTNPEAFITRKSVQVEATDAGATLEKYRLKQELLEVERKYLEALLKKAR